MVGVTPCGSYKTKQSGSIMGFFVAHRRFKIRKKNFLRSNNHFEGITYDEFCIDLKQRKM